jgi:hypothetical protein
MCTDKKKAVFDRFRAKIIGLPILVYIKKEVNYPLGRFTTKI